jgi:predicted dehydrogenase
VSTEVDETIEQYEPEIAVIATPPGSRIGIVERLPTLKAVVVEKPLGLSYLESLRFVDECDRRGIVVQVNFWRRADNRFRALANGLLDELIGSPQAVFGIYGNGLVNNGTHLIDFARMLFGDVVEARSLGSERQGATGPIPNDVLLPFSLEMRGGMVASFQPVDFRYYREVGLDIWGERGRLSIWNEGLGIHHYPREANRAVADEWEISSDCPSSIESAAGVALYALYDNLFAALSRGDTLWSSGESAMRTTAVVSSVLESARSAGSVVPVARVAGT